MLGLLTGLGAAAPALAQNAPPDSITIRLLEASTARADDPRARIYINDHLQPGDTITRRIEVTNTTGSQQALDFYAAAAGVGAGSFSIGEGRASNELTDWTTVEPSSAVVADGASQVITATVRVPADAAPGERYAAVLAERPAAAASSGVTVGARVGIRMYLSVGPGGEPASDFEIETLTAGRADTGEPTVLADIRNTGGRALDLGGELRLSDGPGGLAAGPFPAAPGTTLGVGQTQPVTVVLDEAIDGGPWLATLTLQSGRLERAAEARITFPDEAGASADPVAAQAIGGDNPWVIVAGALIGLLALLLLLYVLLRRRKSRPADDEEPQPVAAPA